MLTRLTRMFVVGVVATALPCSAQNSKVDTAVTRATAQIEKAEASKDLSAQLQLLEEALKGAEKLARDGTTEGLLGASMIQARAGKPELAAATANQALQGVTDVTPGSRARLLAHVAALDMLRGTSKDALEHARQAVDAESNVATLAALALARAHIRDAQAVETAAEAIKADPTSAIAQDALGHALTIAGRYAEAEAALGKALERDPKLYLAHIHRAQLLLAADRAAEAETAARAATQLASQHGIGFAVLGAAMVAKDPHAASRAVNEVATGGILTENHSPYINYVHGDILTLQGRLGEATDAYQKALAVDPGYRPARLALLLAQMRRREYEAALEPARLLAEENLSDGEAQALYGELLFRKQNHAGALGPLERAADLLPRRAAVHAMRGMAHHYNDEPENAVKAYAKAVELAPDNLDYRIKYGLFLGMTNQTEAAVAEITKAIESAGYKGPEGHVNLGYVHLKATPPRPAEASAAYERAVAIDPRNAQGWLGLGRSQLVAKRYDDAVRSLAKVAGLDATLTCEALVTTSAAQIQKVAEATTKEMTAARQALETVRGECPKDPRLVRLAKALEKVAIGEKAETPDDDPRPPVPDMSRVVAELRGPGADVRRAAARRMVVFGADAVPYLRPVLNTDPDLGVRMAVAKALGAIGAPAVETCVPLQTEVAASNERIVLPTLAAGKRLTAAEEFQQLQLEKDLQAACKDARARIRCK
jgi:tetratricopeptide (TPR) repeat protein